MEYVRNRLRLEFIKNYEYKKIIKQQSKLTFAGIQKSFEHCDSYSFRQNEVKMNKPIYLGFAILELSMLHCRRHIMTNYNHTLGKKKLNYTISIPMLSF